MLEGRLAGWLALSSMLTRSCRVAVEGSRQEEEGGERGELLPFYPINTRIPVHQSFIPCPCPCRLILLTTNLHTPLKPWPSTNIPTTKSTLSPKHSNKSHPLTRQASRFRVAGHTTTYRDLPFGSTAAQPGLGLHSRSTAAPC